jgi:competence protein ComEA
VASAVSEWWGSVLSDRIRERLEGLERRELIGLVVIAALIVGAAGVWYLRSMPGPVRIEAASAMRPGGAGAATSAGGRAGPVAGPTPSPAVIVVDVAGWVQHPGVFEFHQGDRVIDAIRRAGGARRGADLASLNLAALLTDAEQVLVGKKGASPGVGTSGTSVGGGGSGAGGAGAKINVNTAAIDQLEELSGIGPVLAQRIIDYRTQHGPFRSLDDLLNVTGIGPSHLADIKQNATV